MPADFMKIQKLLKCLKMFSSGQINGKKAKQGT
jgi:hypothetical protein